LLIYSNDISFDGFSKVQYADGTTIYMPIRSASENVAQGIAQAHQWSLSNNMLLNDSKTVILDVAFSERLGINDPVTYDGTDIHSANSAIFSDSPLTRHQLLVSTPQMLHQTATLSCI